eukprot:6456493-Amphidinium_carterae.1
MLMNDLQWKSEPIRMYDVKERGSSRFPALRASRTAVQTERVGLGAPMEADAWRICNSGAQIGRRWGERMHYSCVAAGSVFSLGGCERFKLIECPVNTARKEERHQDWSLDVCSRTVLLWWWSPKLARIKGKSRLPDCDGNTHKTLTHMKVHAAFVSDEAAWEEYSAQLSRVATSLVWRSTQDTDG